MESMSAATLLWGLLFGSIGMGYAIYGRKQDVLMAMVCGVGLMGYTFFITSPLYIVIDGAVLMALPFIIKF